MLGGRLDPRGLCCYSCSGVLVDETLRESELARVTESLGSTLFLFDRDMLTVAGDLSELWNQSSRSSARSDFQLRW